MKVGPEYFDIMLKSGSFMSYFLGVFNQLPFLLFVCFLDNLKALFLLRRQKDSNEVGGVG